MLASILATGLAAGAIYALVGITYNTMFSTSRVMSFTAGQLAMLGGVFGSMFMLKLGMPILAGFFLTLVGCAIIGVITEFVAVRPVLKNLDQHLYVLSTLALALMIRSDPGRILSDAGRVRDHRSDHRIRRGAAGAQEPRPASLCAVHAGAGADDPI